MKDNPMKSALKTVVIMHFCRYRKSKMHEATKNNTSEDLSFRLLLQQLYRISGDNTGY